MTNKRHRYIFNIQKYKKYFLTKTEYINPELAKVSLDFSKICDQFTNSELHHIAQNIFNWHAPEFTSRSSINFKISSFPHVTNTGFDSYGGNQEYRGQFISIYIDMEQVMIEQEDNLKNRFIVNYDFKDSEDLL